MKRAASASARVQDEWHRRIEEEYRSAALANHLTLWLVQIGASPGLIERGLRITKDELAHATLSHRTYGAAGGTRAPAIVRDTLQLARRPAEPLEHDVTRVALRTFCLGETVAVPLFKVLREECTVPVARKTLDRVLRDEVRHRDFGWLLLDWLFELPMAPALRAIAVRELPVGFAQLRRGYAPESVRTEDQMDSADRAWGLMPPAAYARVVERALGRDWIPRFERRGIDARAAWERAGSSPWCDSR